MSLRRKFPEQIKDVVTIEKEDLSLANHLSGLKKEYMKLVFRNTRDLMDVRRLLLPAVRKNKDKREAQSTYEGLEGNGDSMGKVSDNWLDRIEDIREYDVRCCTSERGLGDFSAHELSFAGKATTQIQGPERLLVGTFRFARARLAQSVPLYPHNTHHL